MDAKVGWTNVERLVVSSLAPLPYIVIGVAPLRSAKSERWMREKLYGTIIPDVFVDALDATKDPADEGRKICLEAIQQPAEIPQVAGCHIMAPGHDSAVPEVIAAARRNVARLKAA